MLLFYVRHGDPIYDPDSLTPLGKRQAEACAKRLSRYGVDKIYASTSTRAIETSQPTCEILKKQAELLDFCNEGHAWRDFTVEGEDGKKDWSFRDKNTEALFLSPEVRALGDKWYEHKAFEKYNFKAGLDRVYNESDKLFAAWGYEHERYTGRYKCVSPTDERIALFAHQGFGIVFLSCLLDIPFPMFSTHFDIMHSGITVIEFKNVDGYCTPKILTLSSDSHIYAEGLPTKYNNRIYF